MKCLLAIALLAAANLGVAAPISSSTNNPITKQILSATKKPLRNLASIREQRIKSEALLLAAKA